MRAGRPLIIFNWTMCIAATLMFLRSYLLGTASYLNLQAYLSGHERLPFQARVLPVPFLDPFYHSPAVMRHFSHPTGMFSPENAPFFFLSAISLAASTFFIIRLYRALSPTGTFSFLVYPLFLFAVMMTYSIHLEQNYRYPYDLPSVAIFAAGFYFIYTRQFTALFFVVFLGTFNRETTLFLIGIYMLDAASSSESVPQRRFSLAAIPWLRFALLTVTWLAIKFALARAFAHNDRSEDYLRIQQNLHTHPGTVPALLNLCGYLLPIAIVLHKRIRPVRFGDYIYILPLWFAVMFCTGILVEVRIFGELCPYAAVATVLLIEQHHRKLSSADTSEAAG